MNTCTHTANAVTASAPEWATPYPMTFDEWRATFVAMVLEFESLPWRIGRCYLYGESRWGDDAAQAVPERAAQTIQNIVWVCRQFPPEKEHKALTFSHHAEVAGQREDVQERLLNKAEAQGLSTRELRREVQALAAGVAPDDDFALAVSGLVRAMQETRDAEGRSREQPVRVLSALEAAEDAVADLADAVKAARATQVSEAPAC